MEKMKILFLCAGNFCRSPTAERLVAKAGTYDVKSAGVFQHAATEVTQEMLDWADVIFVMEYYMRDILIGQAWYWKPFGNSLNVRANVDKIKVLNIPDMFGPNSPALVELLKQRLLVFGIDVTRVRYDSWWQPVWSRLKKLFADDDYFLEYPLDEDEVQETLDSTCVADDTAQKREQP